MYLDGLNEEKCVELGILNKCHDRLCDTECIDEEHLICHNASLLSLYVDIRESVVEMLYHITNDKDKRIIRQLIDHEAMKGLCLFLWMNVLKPNNKAEVKYIVAAIGCIMHLLTYEEFEGIEQFIEYDGYRMNDM